MLISLKRYLKAIVAIIAMICVSSCVTDDDKVTSLEAGDKVPEFTVTLNDGSTLSTADLRGHTSLVVFFSTSCPDCRQELPILQRVYEKKPDDALIVCIAREEDEASIAAFWEANGLTMPYSPQPDRRVYNLFASGIIPRIYCVDPNLIIKAAYGDNNMPGEGALLYLLGAAEQK